MPPSLRPAFVKPAQASIDLAEAARVLHAYCFRPISLETPQLDYEPRSSSRCSECAALWVASKSGSVMRVGLPTPGAPGATQTWLAGSREARAICHLHDGEPLGEPAHSFLLIGRDDGVLELVSSHDPAWQPGPPRDRRGVGSSSIHLTTLYRRGLGVALSALAGVAREPPTTTASATAGGSDNDSDDDSFTEDITAIALVARAWQPGTYDLLVATRYPYLYVIELCNGMLCLRQRHEMPGWIQWIVTQQHGDSHPDQRVTCVTRGGDIVRLSQRQLAQRGSELTTSLSLLPTAALALDDRNLLLGTTTGLFLVCDDRPQAIAVHGTRAPVLCLDRTQVDDGNESHDYITMGLQNRRLQVVHTKLLLALAHGHERPERDNHRFTIDADDAVLEVCSIWPEVEGRRPAYVLAALRDHSVRLYQVTTQQAQRTAVKKAWREQYVRNVVELQTVTVADELDAAEAGPPSNLDHDVWAYMLADEVLRRICEQESPSEADRRRIFAITRRLARSADRRVLYRLSSALGLFTGNDINLVLQLSRAVLRAVPHGDEQRWTAFVDFHLRELHALTGGNDGLSGFARTRLVSWTRFVRKYVLLGSTFASKQVGLGKLVQQNHDAGKYLDALVYQARLSQRGYDLHWIRNIKPGIAAVHAVELQGDDGTAHPAVVVVTSDGMVMFRDAGSGEPLTIVERPSSDGAAARFSQLDAARPAQLRDERGAVRTLASAVTGPGHPIRVVVSCIAATESRVAVIDVEWSGDAMAPVRVVDCTWSSVPERLRIFAIHAIPGNPDAFVVGLDSQARPVGQLWRSDDGWELEPVKDTESPEPPRTLRTDDWQLPTRTLAVTAVDDEHTRCLAIAGSDDGLVRTISFGHKARAKDWKIKRLERLTAAVTCAALHRDAERRDGRDQPDVQLSCYLGTELGDTFALSIREHVRTDVGVPPGSPEYDAEPLWRDTHDSPVLSVQLWRTPLYLGPEVLLVATRDGRLCIYCHAVDYGERQRADHERPISEAYNYKFRGMRFERISTPCRLQALAIVPGRRELVAASPTGDLFLASLAYLREAVDREREPPQPPRTRALTLPTMMWARLHYLFEAAEPRWLDRDPAQPQDPKLDLLDLVRLDGGSLSSYVLPRRLEVHSPSNGAEPARLIREARELLAPLRPSNPEHCERIKIILKSLCRAYLVRKPDELRKAIVDTPGLALARHAEVAEVCTLVAEYITGKLAHSRRLRIVAIKELLRVPVLYHLAQHDQRGRAIRRAVEAALDSCLRDDDRIVRFEAQRALSVMLRNVGVMADSDQVRRAALIQALFPKNLGSLTWLLGFIVRGLQQQADFTRRTALLGSAWYHISVLVQLFRIFPDYTLTLCDYLLRSGLGLRVIATCYRSLRHDGASTIRSKIENLYLLPVLAPQHSYKDYVDRYSRGGVAHKKLLEEIRLPELPVSDAAQQRRQHEWYQLKDAVIAELRLQLLDQLARMWSIKEPPKIAALGHARLHTRPRAPRDVPVGALEAVVDELASIAIDLGNPKLEVHALERLEELANKHGSSTAGRSELTRPVRAIVAGIVGVWRGASKWPEEAQGKEIGGFTLGERIDRDNAGLGMVFKVAAAGSGGGEQVIHVLRDLKSRDAADRFRRAVELHDELFHDPVARDYVVPIVHVHHEPPYLAYVMPKYEVLANHLSAGSEHAHWFTWTERVALHIGRALRAAHKRDRYHGNVRPDNILFAPGESPPNFRLGDFDMAYSADRPGAGIVREWLAHKCQDGQLEQRMWNDVAALALTLYRMLTGKEIAPDTTDTRAHITCLNTLAREQRIRSRPRTLQIIATLKRVLSPGPSFEIDEFLSSIEGTVPWPREARGKATTKVLFLGANPSDTTPAEVNEEYEKIDERLQAVTYREQFEPIPHFAAKAESLERGILRHRPRIVQFSGHGRRDSRLVFHSPDRASDAQHIDIVTQVFRALKKHVKCVVLSACFTDDQAAKIATHIPVVIGTRGAIDPRDATAFSVAFYEALFNGETVGVAYEVGCIALKRERERERSGRTREIATPMPAPSSDEPAMHVIHARRGSENLRFVTPQATRTSARRTARRSARPRPALAAKRVRRTKRRRRAR